jgi:hypothetical protein
MQMIIEARLVDDQGETTPVRLAVVDRELTTSTLGLTLAEGKAVLASAQQYLVGAQCAGIADAHAHCERCEARLTVKGSHTRQLRSLFGRVTVKSPRVRFCKCVGKSSGASFSPLVAVVPVGVTPELEYLEVQWAAHLPYAAATKLLSQILPVEDSVSVSSVKRRVRAVGKELEQSHAALGAARPALMSLEPDCAAQQPKLTALAVDSAWLKHCAPPRRQGRHVNLVAGRACFEDGSTKVYSYVHNQVESAAGRLDQFLAGSGVHPSTRVTILTDGAGEFEKAAKGCAQPICHILDWFHIAMKFQAVERSLFGCKQIEASERDDWVQQVRHAKWLVWHGKASKGHARLQEMDAQLLEREGYEWSTLWWNLQKVAGYIRDNPGLVNYGSRHRKGLPISSSIAESAVNQVVSHRMAKNQQMRWSDEGAHLLAQVRVQEINGELRPRAVPTPRRSPKPSHDPQWDAYLMRLAA